MIHRGKGVANVNVCTSDFQTFVQVAIHGGEVKQACVYTPVMSLEAKLVTANDVVIRNVIRKRMYMYLAYTHQHASKMQVYTHQHASKMQVNRSVIEQLVADESDVSNSPIFSFSLLSSSLLCDCFLSIMANMLFLPRFGATAAEASLGTSSSSIETVSPDERSRSDL